MSRGRHRKSKSPKFAKSAKVVALSLLLGVAVQPTTAALTEAAFTDSSSASVSVKAAQWVVPTVTTSGYNTTTVTWQAIPGYTNYTVQRSKTPEFDLPITETVSGTSYTTKILTEASTYYWRVKPTTNDANIAWSLLTSGKTNTANGSVTQGDLLAYKTDERITFNYGKTSQNAAGTLRKSVLTNTNIPTHMFVTDWNSDGIEDIFTQNTAGTGSLDVQLGKANGGFTPFTVGYGTWNEYDVTVGRWPKTTSAPAILAIEKVNGALWFYTNPSGGNHGPRTGIGNGWGGFSIAIVDFDGDGNSDVIAKQPATGNLIVYRGDGNAGFYSEARQQIGVGWNSMDCIGIIEDSERLGSKGIVAREIFSANLFYYPIENGIVGPRRAFGEGFYNYKISGS